MSTSVNTLLQNEELPEGLPQPKHPYWTIIKRCRNAIKHKEALIEDLTIIRNKYQCYSDNVSKVADVIAELEYEIDDLVFKAENAYRDIVISDDETLPEEEKS